MLQRLELHISELLANLRRNGLLSVATLITVMSSLVIFGLFGLTIANLRHVLLEESRKAQVSAYLPADISQADIATLQQQLKQIPGVREVKFVSQAQAFELLKKQLASDMLDAIGTEGAKKLPAKFSVTPTGSDSIESIAATMRTMAGISEVNYGGDVVFVLNNLLKGVRRVGLVAFLLLTLATVANVATAIRLTIYARRREIRIMQLVGATDGFVRAPFLLEGLFHGLMGSTLAALATFLLYRHMAASAQQLIPFLKLISPDALRLPYALGMIGFGSLLGLFSALYALGRYLSED